ncbi:MAG: hypothetical protein HY267_04550 [Deltaproteobacteria bacterium]|nr:hypothetical protein [Deltaproteobacteria bacterium]
MTFASVEEELMQTPGIVLYNSLAPGLIEKTVTYAQLVEERGVRATLNTFGR